ncbi:unnamed protein product [Amoebophrya sp. A25]|nr:unnamed protein product [Amoebophrya sp. A25]|eukprot:GSA25T00002853001.1
MEQRVDFFYPHLRNGRARRIRRRKRSETGEDPGEDQSRRRRQLKALSEKRRANFLRAVSLRAVIRYICLMADMDVSAAFRPPDQGFIVY